MKAFYLSLVLIISAAFSANSQAPEKFNYQAIVRNVSGTVITNQTVGVRVSILQGSIIGPAVFVETHTPTTNNYGLINLQIGAGSNIGPQLNTIDWSANSYFVRIEIDPAGGTFYSLASSSQLISVPYALHAKTADYVDDADADPTNEYITNASLSGTTLNITDGGSTQSVNLSTLINDADSNPINEIQTISKVGSVISLSLGGGAITDDVNDADANPANELQTITKVGNVISLSLGGGSVTDAVNDADPDPINEIQTVTKVGSTVTLSLGGGSFTVDDADPSATNEIQTISKVGSTVTLSLGGGSITDSDAQTLSIVGSNLSISGGNTVAIPGGTDSQTMSLVGTNLSITGGNTVNLVSLQDGVNDADSDPTNEIQNLTLVGSDLSISGGNTITLGGGTDSQILSIVGSNLSISNGNTVALPGGTDSQTLSIVGNNVTITGGNTIAIPANTDSQTLSIVGSNLSITGGNTVAIPGGTDSQTLSLLGTNITITGGNTLDLASLQDGVNDADADPNNEIQSLSLVGSDLTISGGNTITLPGGTDSQTLSLVGSNLTITGGNTIALPIQTHFVGEHFGGGIIVWVDSSGQHGLICATADLPGTYIFETLPNNGTAFATSLFDGAANTATLVALGPGEYMAAEAADAYAGGGFTDWYLPSLFEVEKLLLSNHVLRQYALYTTGATYYWSSTELAATGINAYRGLNATGTALSNTSQTSSYAVRPVRQF